MTEREALLIVINIDSDERSARRQAFLEMLVADRGDAEEQISRIFSVTHFFEHDRCCGRTGEPRRPASGQARLQAFRQPASLTRGWGCLKPAACLDAYAVATSDAE